MAGEGSRFKAEGYKHPKPLIEVSGKPMIINAIHCLPKANKYVFVCQQEQIEKYKLNEILSNSCPNSEIIGIDYLTDGQASTCMLAEKFIDPESQLIIGACDNGMTWNIQNFNSLIHDQDLDALIWTFRNNITVKHNPEMYGWVKVGNHDFVKGVSCKKPISKNPVKDHAVVGTFWFRKAEYFFSSAKKMIQSAKTRVNNEYYVDELFNEMIVNKYKVKVFEISKYLCWGTPNDLKIYNYWKSFFTENY